MFFVFISSYIKDVKFQLIFSLYSKLQYRNPSLSFFILLCIWINFFSWLGKSFAFLWI